MLNCKKSFIKYGIIAIMAVLIGMSSQITAAVHKSIRLCFSTVIPSLFPFMVLSSAFVANFSEDSGGISEKICKHIFGISGCASSAFICSLICGYPIGAKCTLELYKAKKISASEAESLIAYLNNAGPLFVIGAVGVGMLGSLKAGILLYCVELLSAFSAGIILSKSTQSRIYPTVSGEKHSKDFTACICESVSSILNVCGFIIFFAVINALVMPITENLCTPFKSIVVSFLEITNGISSVCNGFDNMSSKLIFTSASLGWSGLSVHMQVKSILGKSGLSMKKYYITRLYMSAFSAIIMSIAVKFTDNIFLFVVGKEALIFVSISTLASLFVIKRKIRRIPEIIRTCSGRKI